MTKLPRTPSRAISVASANITRQATIARLLAATALAAAALAAPIAARAVDVGVSVGISQPGVYGRIDIGRFPQPPQVVVAQPVVIAPAPIVVAGPPRPVLQPVYLWVPPGHQKNWRKHCGSYGACGTPVYFVRDDWYERNVQGRDGWKDEKRRGKGKGKKDDD